MPQAGPCSMRHRSICWLTIDVLRHQIVEARRCHGLNSISPACRLVQLVAGHARCFHTHAERPCRVPGTSEGLHRRSLMDTNLAGTDSSFNTLSSVHQLLCGMRVQRLGRTADARGVQAAEQRLSLALHELVPNNSQEGARCAWVESIIDVAIVLAFIRVSSAWCLALIGDWC